MPPRDKYREVKGPVGSRLRPDHKDGPQRIRISGKWWSDEAEQVFLDHLAASCNVSWAAEETGFSTVTVYNHRRINPAFAQRWQEALEQGYARLEMELVHTANNHLAGLKLDPEASLKAMTVRDAITLLGMHRRSVALGSPMSGKWVRPRTLDEVRDSILRKLEAIEAARAQKE